MNWNLPNVTIGILGGGQLARMSAYAASRLGMRVAILEAEENSPAGQISAYEFSGKWSDRELLKRFAAASDVITLENEFVDSQILRELEALGKPVYPSALTLALVQDKARQKQTIASAGLPVPAFARVQQAAEVEKFAAEYGYPLVLKARRNGYDGRGNFTIMNAADIEEGFIRLGAPERSLMVEQYISFSKELALMVARNLRGESAVYPLVETVQKNHICHIVTTPAAVPPSVAEKAAEIGRKAIESIGGIGIYGIEMFLTADNRVVINELAPRPHNSGHYSIEACRTSQFENHLRAVLNLPLGSPDLIAPAAMVNLLGTNNAPVSAKGMEKALAVPGANIHIYGKKDLRPGRKMGHITALAPGGTVADALKIAQEAAGYLEF